MPFQIMANELAIEPPPNPQRMATHEVFYYYTPFHVMICRQCQCAVVDAQVHRHLRNLHRGRPKAQFRASEVLEYFKQFPTRIRSTEELALPSEPIPAVPFLSVYQDTFQCGESSCRWIGQSLHRIQEHCRRQHGWKRPPTYEQSTAITPWATVLSQQFISHGPGSQRFAILPSTWDESLSHHTPARSPTPLSNPPPLSSPALAKVPSPRELAKTPTPTPAQSPRPASNSTRARSLPPKPTTQTTTEDDKLRAQSSDPPTQPRKRKQPHTRRLSLPLAQTTIEHKKPRAQPSHTPPPRPLVSSPKQARDNSLSLQWACNNAPSDLQAQFTLALEKWDRECPVCRAKGLPLSTRTHQLTSCEEAYAKVVRRASSQLLQCIDVQSASCWGCGLPKLFCDKLKDRPNTPRLLTPNRVCYALRIMAPTIISIRIFDTAQFKLIVKGILKGKLKDMEDTKKVHQWLAQEVQWTGFPITRLAKAFYCAVLINEIASD